MDGSLVTMPSGNRICSMFFPVSSLSSFVMELDFTSAIMQSFNSVILIGDTARMKASLLPKDEGHRDNAHVENWRCGGVPYGLRCV